MGKTIFILFAVLTSLTLYAQDITGPWYGILKVQETQLRVVFNIIKTDNGYSSTMDSPDQGTKGTPLTSTSFENSVLKLELPAAKIIYEGTLDKENKITGTYKQDEQSFELNLSREKIEKEKLIRPQEPIQPYPYYTEDVVFENKKAKITLSGTLSLPAKEGNYPVVVMISGSGPQNRNEELLGHKPFLVIADHLTKNGIGVLRFDDRGVGESKGDFKTATSQDFATDVEAAVKYLKTRKEINKKKIGLIGHSEGGIIAPMVVAKSKDVHFIVLLAGTGIPGDQLLLLQQELISRASGISDDTLLIANTINKGAYDIILKSTYTEILRTDLTNYFKQVVIDYPESVKSLGMSVDDLIKLQVMQLTSPWMQYFIKYDPSIILEKVKCPVLAINGSKDLQVPSKINLEAIKKSLEKGDNKNFTTKELPNLNHLFQNCETGSPSEYAIIEETFSPLALDEITIWINKQVK